MKGLKTRGALIIEYALLLAVCCILGVIYLDAAPGVRDGVEPIKTKTEKVLSDANNSINGDKPSEGGHKPSLPTENTNFHKDKFSGIIGTDQNHNPVDKTNNEIANELRRVFWKEISDQGVDNYAVQNGKYGQVSDVTTMSWDKNGVVTVNTTKGSFTGTVNVQNSQEFKNAGGNYGILPANGGTLVFENGNVVQHNADKTVYTNFTVNTTEGAKVIGYDINSSSSK